MNRLCRNLARILVASLLTALAGYAAAQTAYPNKPIRLISPFAPGGSVTVVAHMLGTALSDSLGQQVFVDNRPGGNTIIGTELLAKSAPDGYTLEAVTNTHVVNPSLFPTPYDALRDFVGVGTVCVASQLLVVNPSFPAHTVQEVIALLKSRPGKFDFASSGNGTTNHMAGEFFKLAAGVDMQHIPYKGGGPAITDLIGGQVQLSFQAPATAMNLIKSGRVRAIATASKARISALPDLPTFAEAGLPGFEAEIWYGILAPAGTPKDIVQRLSSEIAKAVATPELKKRIASEGMEPFVTNPEEVAALMRSDFAKYAKIIKAAKIKIDN